MQQPSRRTVLIGGGTAVAALVGGTLVYVYTGPVDLRFHNYVPTARTVDLTLSEGGQTAFSDTYDIPAATADGEAGVRAAGRIIDTAIHGTTYQVSLTLDGRPLDRTWPYTPTCTGSDLHDVLDIDLLTEESADDVDVGGSYCGPIL